MRPTSVPPFSAAPRRPPAAGRKIGGGKPIHPAGFLNAGVRLPRLTDAVPREICLGDPDAALRLLEPLLRDGDLGRTGQDFLRLAVDRLVAPFAAHLSEESGPTVCLCDTPEAYEAAVGNREDKLPVAGSLLIAFRDLVHTHAYVGAFLMSQPPALAEWFVSFLNRLPMVLGPADYRSLVERVAWRGEDSELGLYSDCGQLSDFDAWAGLTADQKALAERALTLGDRATLEELLRPGFPTRRAFEADYPAWALEGQPLEGDQTRVLEALAEHDPELAQALMPFFPNGSPIPAPKTFITPYGCGGYFGIAFWKREDLVAHVFDEEYEQVMQSGEDHLYFARVDIEPTEQSIRAAQETMRAVLDYYLNVGRLFTLLNEREPSAPKV